jgi:hypothetical protein
VDKVGNSQSTLCNVLRNTENVIINEVKRGIGMIGVKYLCYKLTIIIQMNLTKCQIGFTNQSLHEYRSPE